MEKIKRRKICVILLLMTVLTLTAGGNYTQGTYLQKELQFADTLFVDKLIISMSINKLDIRFSEENEYWLEVSDFCDDFCCIKLQCPRTGLHYNYDVKEPLEFICAGKIVTNVGTFYLDCHPLSFELNKNLFLKIFEEKGAGYKTKFKKYNFNNDKLDREWLSNLYRYCDDIYVFKYNWNTGVLVFSNTEYPCE